MHLDSQILLFVLAALVILAAGYVVVRRLIHVSFPDFFLGLVGLVLGLIVGSLVGSILTNLPGNFGRYGPVIANIVITVGIFELFLTQTERANEFLAGLMRRDGRPSGFDVVVDTSALIDGRIEQIVDTGFLPGTMLIPQVVLKELQTLADSRDGLKRARGRRGLDVLTHLRDQPKAKINVLAESEEEKTVDGELIRLAQKHHAHLLTLDYNLNQIAHIRGVHVLNINALAAALRPILLPGETLMVSVIQPGKEPEQGVGFMPDGTMIIVEGGDRLVGQEVECEVERIYQTLSGKIVFVSPAKAKRSTKRLIAPTHKSEDEKKSNAESRPTLRERILHRGRRAGDGSS